MAKRVWQCESCRESSESLPWECPSCKQETCDKCFDMFATCKKCCADKSEGEVLAVANASGYEF